MGFWSSLFGYEGPSDGDGKIKETVKTDPRDGSTRGDKLTFTGGDRGEHVHQSYDVDRSSGTYKEYHGGENSPDRHYNK